MPERAPARSIYILILLFLINLMNFFDRTIPAVVLEPIRREFGLDDTALGILGASFTLIYAVAGVPLGYLADRLRRTHILAAGLTAWSLLTAASGLAWSFLSFFWIRLLVGVGEASCAPAANSLIGDLFPSEKRARALGIFMLGLPLGLLLAFSIVGALAQNYGWRVPFYLAAVTGFVVAAMVLFAAEPVRGSQETYAIEPKTALERPMRRMPRRFCYRCAGYSTSGTTAAFIPHCMMSSNPGCGPPQWPSTSFNPSSERVSAPLSPARCRRCTQGKR